MLKENSLDESLAEITQEEEQINLLRKHTAQKIAQIAARDRRFIFDKLRKKVKDAAEHVSKSPLSGKIVSDMEEVSAVRKEAEAIFGTINPEDTKPQEQGPSLKSNQLNFLIGVQLTGAASFHNPKQVQGEEVHASSYTAELPQP